MKVEVSAVNGMICVVIVSSVFVFSLSSSVTHFNDHKKNLFTGLCLSIVTSVNHLLHCRDKPSLKIILNVLSSFASLL